MINDDDNTDVPPEASQGGAATSGGLGENEHRQGPSQSQPSGPAGTDRAGHMRNRLFIPFLVDLVRDDGCCPGPALLYGVLACRLDRYKKTPFAEGLEVLAGLVGVSSRTITRRIGELQETKDGRRLITSQQLNKQHYNRFELLNRDDPARSYQTREEVLAGSRYIAVPQELLLDGELVLKEALVWSALVHRLGPGYTSTWPRLGELATDLGLGQTAVKEALKGLVEKGRVVKLGEKRAKAGGRIRIEYMPVPLPKPAGAVALDVESRDARAGFHPVGFVYPGS